MRRKVQNLLNAPPSLLALDMNDEVDAASDIVLYGIKAQATASPHDQSGDPMDGLVGAAGVDGRQRPAVAGIHGVK